MAIIGVSGKINSGKDLIGAICQHQISNSRFPIEEFVSFDSSKRAVFSHWQIKKFADKLKDIICLLIGCTREQLEDRTFKETPLGEEWDYYIRSDSPFKLYTIEEYNNLHVNQQGWLERKQLTPRLLLQLLGTQCGREIIHPNIWVNALMANYRPYIEAPEGIISNNWESNWIITDVRFPNEAKAIKDKGGILIRVNRPANAVFEEHESETALDDYRHFDAYINNYGTIEDLVEKVRAILISKKII